MKLDDIVKNMQNSGGKKEEKAPDLDKVSSLQDLLNVGGDTPPAPVAPRTEKKVVAKKEVQETPVKDDGIRRAKIDTPTDRRGLMGATTVNADGTLDVGDVPENLRIKLSNSFIGPYLKDPGYTDLKYNGTQFRVQHNTKGRYMPENQPTLQEVESLIISIANEMGRKLTNTTMEMDVEVGYLRLNAIHEVVSLDGMTFSMRVSRPRLAITDLDDLAQGNGEILDQLFNVLVQAEQNLLVSGRTGTGKTELQKFLIQYISDDSIIIVIEDTRDSHIKAIYPEKDVISWRTVPGSYEMSDGVKSGLRNNPDWIIIAETRGAVSADVLDSAKTDHAIITTLHAKSAFAIPSRLIPMIRQSTQYARTDDQVIGNEIAEHLKFGIQLHAEIVDGRMIRYISEIAEYTGYTAKGAKGNSLYKFGYKYNRETQEYTATGSFGKMSIETAETLESKRLIHLLPDVFNPLVD